MSQLVYKLFLLLIIHFRTLIHHIIHIMGTILMRSFMKRTRSPNTQLHAAPPPCVPIYTSACPMNMLRLTSATTSFRSSLPTSTMPLPLLPIRPARPNR